MTGEKTELSPKAINQLFTVMQQIAVFERLLLLVPNLPDEMATRIFADTVSYRLAQKRAELVNILNEVIGELR